MGEGISAGTPGKTMGRKGNVFPPARFGKVAVNANDDEADPRDRILDLLAAGTAAELQLLKSERKAERRLADALDTLASDKARLRKVQQRVERSREAVAAAEASLREVQERRAAGPLVTQD